MGIVELEHFTTLEAAHEPWPILAERSGNLFASWEWVSTWWRHFGAGRELAGAIARRAGGEPAAILPLYVYQRRPLTVLRFLGHGPGDWLGPIHASEDRELAAEALRAKLAAGGHWDVLLAERVRGDEPATQSLGGTVLQREAFPILPFRDRSWEQLLAERSANFRQQVRRRERRLARAHRLSYRLTTDPEQLDGDLELLFTLHEAHWRHDRSSAFASARRAFHRDFARLALARGWLRLWVMELDDRPVAAWYGFRYAGAECYYQSGRDPAHDAGSVGFVLLCHTIRAAIEDGAEAYWFLRGDEPYKDRFAEQDPTVATIALANSLRGRGAVAAVTQLRRLPATGRRWMRARVG
jgi:CelD/BcsL family acetyltransferase involved in cellulose biosynthesis